MLPHDFISFVNIEVEEDEATIMARLESELAEQGSSVSKKDSLKKKKKRSTNESIGDDGEINAQKSLNDTNEPG